MTKTFTNIASMENQTKLLQWNKAKWDARSKTYDSKIFDYFRYFQKKVIDQMDILPHQHILDIGCGTGWAVHSIAKKLNDKGKFIGVDISEGMIDRAKQKVKGFKNVHFYRSSSDELPFENEYFDFAICTNSFHHYPNPHRTIEEIYRVIKANGQVLILDVTMDNFAAKALNLYFKLFEKEHVQFYNHNEYFKMFTSIGFEYKICNQPGFIFKIHKGKKH